MKKYSFIDNDFTKTYFYRLKFIDKDGSTFYSHQNKLEYKLGLNFKFYPNPVNDKIIFENPKQIQKVIITNLIGQNVLESSINANQINVSGLKTGIYILKIFVQEKIYQDKFFKQ